MKLSDIEFKLQYRSDRDDLINDFYIPCMKASVKYDRAVGYFSSHALAQASIGIEEFIKNGGKIRIIASPNLQDDDIKAIEGGIQAREDVITAALIREIKPTQDTIETHVLSFLSWLIYNGQLEIKIAVLKQLKRGLYHEKIGVFTDFDGKKLAFTGSANETEGGYSNNFESLDIYVSNNERDQLRVDLKESDFESMWNNFTTGLDILTFPEAAKRKLLEYRKDEEREYIDCNFIKEDEKERFDIRVPGFLKVRDYQKEAINEWIKNNGIGILEMATGTGKTITALYLISQLYKKFKKLAIVIVCPYQHLVNQWNREAKDFNISSVLCFGSKKLWQGELQEQINNYNLQISSYISIITTNSTFCSTTFKDMLDEIGQPVLLVFDEAHHVGTQNFRKYLSDNIKFRIALSATPDRWYDDEGNKIITDYFDKIVYSFPLEKAIGKFLTNYYYYPHIVYLTQDESDEYFELSIQIAKYYWSSKTGDHESYEALKRLMIKRSKIVGGAYNKMEILKECMKDRTESKYNLFYAGDSKHEGERQIEKVIRMLGSDLGMRVTPFTSEESKEERENILKLYESGYYQAIVAIKCLDEGVNIPLIQTAYILSSSSNPREFIQRRGRVLRKHPLKDFSYIHDFIVVPSNIRQIKKLEPNVFNVERSLMKKELRRINEFCNTALNGPAAMNVLLEIKEAYNLLDM